MKEFESTSWPLEQLNRFAKLDPKRLNHVLNQLFAIEPKLFADLAIGAVDQEMLSIQEASKLTGYTLEEVEWKLLQFRNGTAPHEVQIEADPARGNVAQIVGTGVAVWEVIREARRANLPSDVQDRFPSLGQRQISAALAYADAHAEEIERDIERYEAVVQRRKLEYPFSQ